MAVIFSVAGGASLIFAIVAELGGRMVLLIPDAIRKIKEAARKEQRQAQQKRRREAYERFGAEVDGVVMLPRTPEVEAFLNGEDLEDSSYPWGSCLVSILALSLSRK
jgi:hypothetical protein